MVPSLYDQPHQILLLRVVMHLHITNLSFKSFITYPLYNLYSFWTPEDPNTCHLNLLIVHKEHVPCNWWLQRIFYEKKIHIISIWSLWLSICWSGAYFPHFSLFIKNICYALLQMPAFSLLQHWDSWISGPGVNS